MYDRYTSEIGRDRRIAITLSGTDVLVSATTYQNKRLAPIQQLDSSVIATFKSISFLLVDSYYFTLL